MIRRKGVGICLDWQVSPVVSFRRNPSLGSALRTSALRGLKELPFQVLCESIFPVGQDEHVP